MYNARAFFAVDVLVHVGAPVREVALHGKRYTLPAPPPSTLRTFPACISILGRLLPFLLSSRSPSLFRSFRPRGRTFAIGPWYRSTSTYTAYSNEPEDCPMYLGRLTGFSKLKRGDRGARVADSPKPTDPRTERSRFTGFGCSCFFSACSLRSILARASSSSSLMLASSSYPLALVSLAPVPLRRLTSFSFLADYTKIVKVRRIEEHDVKDGRS